MKKKKTYKKSKRFAEMNNTGLLENMNAASATDMTGLIPAAPETESAYQNYSDVYQNLDAGE